jgi:spermidine synthase
MKLSSNATSSRPTRWMWAVLSISGIAACAVLFVSLGASRDPHRAGPIEYEVTSDFSRIRVRRQENVRTLLFVNDRGRELVESRIDLKEPHRLLLPYTRFMFASYLFAPEPRRALIVGLGGGGMIHFLRHHDADLVVDVVEIDPVVIRVAEQYFGVRSEGNVRIIQDDARKFLDADGEAYDVIYMDAFLGESEATDASGVPLHLKNAPFFEVVQSRLTPEGVVVFNLHQHRNHRQDLDAIRAAFAQAYVFDVPASGNVIVVATVSRSRSMPQSLRERAAELGRAFSNGVSFQTMLESMADE